MNGGKKRKEKIMQWHGLAWLGMAYQSINKLSNIK